MSKIEVNTVDAQCGSTVTIGSAGKTVSVPGNIVKSNALQASDGGNIVNQCGTTVTLGATGDTIALASGASQTGFGRTGTVDWVTTPKTATFSAVSGEGYFVNTTAGTITINLPAGAAGSIVSMADYAGTWQTYNVTVTPNGSEKIGSINANVTLDTEGQSVTFVYVDSTQGWLNTMDSTSNVRPNPFIVATGGTPCTGAIVCTNYKVHKFTGPGTFTVTSAGAPGGSTTVDYLVVAGGGGGGNLGMGGGGGAGGYRESNGTASGCYTVSPLATTPTTVPAIAVSVSPYAIAVGGGGAKGPPSPLQGLPGSISTFDSVTSAGGGGGGRGAACAPGRNGGSGGGNSFACAGGNGNTPPTTPPQGQDGSSGFAYPTYNAGGGGGATTAGSQGSPSNVSGPGGSGATSSIDATPTARAGGGGGGIYSPPVGGTPGSGGPGGGGSGSNGPGAAGSGGCNTGGGGGGGGSTPAAGQDTAGAGGSGIVIIRYKFQ